MPLDQRRLLHDLQVAGLHVTEVETVRAPTVWRAAGPAGAFVVRWAPEAEAAELEATLRWTQRLSDAGLPVPTPWRSPGMRPALAPAAGGLALVHRWTEGTQVSEAGWDEDSAEALGELLAAAHLEAERPPPLLTPASGDAASVRRYDEAWARGAWDRSAAERVLPSSSLDERTTVDRGVEAATQVLVRAWSGGPGGPVIVVHADVHAGNVLSLDDGTSESRRRRATGSASSTREPEKRLPRLALIDLGRVGLAPVALDLALALLDHEDTTTWSLLRAYRRMRPLDASFEDVYGAFRVLAMVDNLRFLAAFEQERAFIEASWPGLVAACAALLADGAAPRSRRKG